MTQALNGRFDEVERVLSAALVPAASSIEHSCAGLALINVAALLSASGRLAQAEVFAERSIHILEENYAADDPVFLRPLHIVVSARFEHRQIWRAREAFRKMQALRTEKPEDRALLYGLSATLLSVEGRYQEAEFEYLAALRAWERAGRGNMADAGVILNALGCLYLNQKRLEDARRVLDHAYSIFTSAADAVPLDCFKLLRVRAVMNARQKRWQDAEHDLHDAVAMTGSLPELDPAILAPVLADYAYVLRKIHRGQEALSFEARAAALRASSVSASVVDVAELARRPQGHKK